MRRALSLASGIGLCFLAVAVALAVSRFFLGFSATYDVTIQTVAVAVPVAILALIAAVTTLLTGLRLIAPRRFAFPRLRHLSATSAVTMAGTLAVAAWNIYSLETRPFHSAAATAALDGADDLDGKIERLLAE